MNAYGVSIDTCQWDYSNKEETSKFRSVFFPFMKRVKIVENYRKCPGYDLFTRS